MFCHLFISVLAVVSVGASLNHSVIRSVADRDKAEKTLVLTHVLFRHGNRTAQKEELYPKDPYLNFDYFPFGNGQLTNEGKRKEYSIGQALRARYGNFLGDYYYPEIVEAWSTDYNRTKMSLQLVLASLFPPNGVESWNRQGLNWQPVPYNYKPRRKDKVLIGMFCPRFENEVRQYEATGEYKQKISEKFDTVSYISANTGMNITTFAQIYNLYFGLSTEEEWGFKLPRWTKKVWPEKIVQLAIREYYVHTATTNLKKMAVGYFLKKILDDTKRKINNLKRRKGVKMYMYSAHENNVAEFLLVLDILNPPHIPTYGSFIVVEVHKVNGVYGLKIYYQNYTSSRFELLKLPACEEFCALDKFESLVAEYLPSDDFCEAQST